MSEKKREKENQNSPTPKIHPKDFYNLKDAKLKESKNQKKVDHTHFSISSITFIVHFFHIKGISIWVLGKNLPAKEQICVGLITLLEKCQAFSLCSCSFKPYGPRLKVPCYLTEPIRSLFGQTSTFVCTK